MRVGRHGNPHTGLAREPRVRVPEVEAVGLRVDLEGGTGLRGALDDTLDVDWSAGPLKQTESLR